MRKVREKGFKIFDNFGEGWGFQSGNCDLFFFKKKNLRIVADNWIIVGIKHRHESQSSLIPEKIIF